MSARAVKDDFETASWKLEPRLNDDNTELSASQQHQLRAASQLRNKNDTIFTKPGKGYGVVVMDKSDYTRLLNEASINDNPIEA